MAILFWQGATNLGEVTISVAESLSLKDALRCPKHKGFPWICVEGYSKLVIDVVQDLCSVSWRPRPMRTFDGWLFLSFVSIGSIFTEKQIL